MAAVLRQRRGGDSGVNSKISSTHDVTHFSDDGIGHGRVPTPSVHGSDCGGSLSSIDDGRKVGSPSAEASVGGDVFTSSTFWTSRALTLRILGALYLVIFLSTEAEAPLLIGHRGLSPAAPAIAKLRRMASDQGVWTTFLRTPSLLHLLPAAWFDESDFGHILVCRCGAFISLVLALGLSEHVLVLLSAWCLYNSIKEVGGPWYGFAWEPQLCETAFCCGVFLCPFTARRFGPPQPLKDAAKSSRGGMPLAHHVGRTCLAVLAFRVMLAAGLLKQRARDPCWRDYTCFLYHYENMPMPNPLSWFMHYLPLSVHSWVQYISIDVVELILPYGFLLSPFEVVPLVGRFCRLARRSAALSSILLMIGIQGTGNYAFLNIATCLPCFACLDDRLLHHLLPRCLRPGQCASPGTVARVFHLGSMVIAASAFAALSMPGFSWLALGNEGIAHVPPVALHFWERFGRPLDLGNMYSSGRFAHVTRQRSEVVLWGLECTDVNEDRCKWLELDVPCKPGSLDRAPCVTAPFHRRFAWQFWFVGLGHDAAWLHEFCERLVAGDAAALSALERDAHRPPLMAVQARLYRYRFSSFDAWRSGQLRRSSSVATLPHVATAAAMSADRRSQYDNLPPLPADVADTQGLWWRRTFEGREMPLVRRKSGDLLHGNIAR
eukprot:TRINITY_DN44509_c0_g1_i1.p1 TRINITY_DN44509_c0_g1~~TRINITY_DN44509_c0_g1_i1.p1  ORF type:complete len:662 (+),score=80.03 TRINITY_DN44509_c0_g1_i1:134-2119(+)